MDWQQILDPIKEVSIPIITAIITALGGILIAYLEKLRKKTAEQTLAIKDDSLRNLINDAISRTMELSQQTVTAIQQELVTDIKQGILNGVNTREELLALKDDAVKSVIAQLTPSIKETLENQFTDLEVYVGNLVSSYVYELRKSNDEIPVVIVPDACEDFVVLEEEMEIGKIEEIIE